MKFKIILSAAFLSIFGLAGCGNDNNTNEQSLQQNKVEEGTLQERNRIVDELEPSREDAENEELNNQLGYVNYTRDQIENEAEQNHDVNMNREEMADNITRIILRNEGFDEVATLVTDENVLIVYDKNEELEQEDAADIAKKTAVSLMPGFFDIYVSDNEALIDDIRSLHNSTTDDNHNNTIDQIISEMKKSPQGTNEENLQMN